MDAVMEVHNRSQKYLAPIVRFERMPVDDIAASRKAGQYVAKDVDYAYITPPFSKDEVVKKAEAFLIDNTQKVSLGQMPREVAERYKLQYEAWKNGQELPLEGTAIKGWPMISPAQQSMLIDRKIMTVEMLSQANDAALQLIGMGGVALRNMAQNWLAQAKDKGPLTMQMTEVQKENDILKGSIASLTKQVEELRAAVKASPIVQAPVPVGAASMESMIFDDVPVVNLPHVKAAKR